MIDFEKYKFAKNDVIYDIETYPNVYTFTYYSVLDGEMNTFEISNYGNDTEEFLEYLRNVKRNNLRLVGFNNLGFDYPVIHYILERAVKAKSDGGSLKITANQIYKYAMKVIDSKKNGEFGISVKVEDIILPQLDLYKINHFDNRAKATSLKLLEFNMRSKNIEDLPFEVGSTLSKNEIETLVKYNKHDVKETYKFYIECLDSILFREELSVKYGFDCTNLNDTKIGEQFFMRKIEAETPTAFYTVDEYGRRKMKQTKRESIAIKDCIFPYIRFKRPEFKALLEWLQGQVITETKGVFNDIEEHLLGDLAKYVEFKTKKLGFKNRHKVNGKGVMQNDFDLDDWQQLNELQQLKDEFLKEHPKGWFEEKQKTKNQNRVSVNAFYNVAENIHVMIDGFRLDIGTGGIHGSVQGQVHSDSDTTLIDADVKSFYPNMAIANRVYPEHLNESFCDSYEDFYKERGNYAKGTGENLAIKLGLNATYGNSNNQFSPFYDPKYTMTITIGGQLSLCMLIEKLIDDCDINLLQVNTDGFTFKVKNDEIDNVRHIIRRWEKVTLLEMEECQYSSMFIRDVNSYIAVYSETGKLKAKGAYEYKDLAWHKNMSALVIPMAVEHEVMGKGSAKEFILNHKNEFDFMLRAKVPRSSKLITVDDNGVETQQQNICRYYPCKDGEKLVKLMPDGNNGWKQLGIDTEWKIKVCNDMDNFQWDIDYDYYIKEVNKLLEPFKEEVYKYE